MQITDTGRKCVRTLIIVGGEVSSVCMFALSSSVEEEVSQ